MKIMFISDTAILFLPCWGLGSMMKISLLHKIGNLALTWSYIKNIKFSKGNFGKHLHRNCINNNNARQDVYA